MKELKRYYAVVHAVKPFLPIMGKPRGCCSIVTVNCRSTSRVIGLARGAWLIAKFTSLAKVVPGPLQLYSAESWPKTRFIHFISWTTPFLMAYLPKMATRA